MAIKNLLKKDSDANATLRVCGTLNPKSMTGVFIVFAHSIRPSLDRGPYHHRKSPLKKSYWPDPQPQANITASSLELLSGDDSKASSLILYPDGYWASPRLGTPSRGQHWGPQLKLLPKDDRVTPA